MTCDILRRLKISVCLMFVSEVRIIKRRNVHLPFLACTLPHPHILTLPILLPSFSPLPYQDLPNYAQHSVPIFSLPQEWLWCESWCGNATKAAAKTIDLCNNPMTKEPKLQVGNSIVFCMHGTFHPYMVCRFLQRLDMHMIAFNLYGTGLDDRG